MALQLQVHAAPNAWEEREEKGEEEAAKVSSRKSDISVARLVESAPEWLLDVL